MDFWQQKIAKKFYYIFACVFTKVLHSDHHDLYFTLAVVVEGHWSPWRPWESCSATCGGGKQLRGRSCSNPEPANGGADCVGPSEDTKTCSLWQCPSGG